MTSRARLAPWFLVAAVSWGGVACSSSSAPGPAAPPPSGSDGGAPTTDAQYSAAVVGGMHDSLLHDLQTLHQAAVDLQAAAPAPQGRGWSAADDAAAIASMRAAWTRARTAYERIEGALAPLFPDIDASIDARYDDFLTNLLGSGGDADLFDDAGVTGLHAVERIVYSDVTPQRVVDFEKVLPGYVAARFPATQDEAAAFKTKLCAKIVSDAQELLDQWTPAKIDVAIAFQGLVSLMNEQREKVNKAATNEEESRYSQRTMADIRDNLAGTTTIYAIFEPWIVSKTSESDPTKDGRAADAKITAGFKALESAYAEVSSDAIPEPPPTWSSLDPSQADLATPFGKLYSHVRAAVDPDTEAGVVFQMNRAAAILGFPQFEQR